MKKCLLFFIVIYEVAHAQNETRSLVNSQQFINLVASISNKQLDIRDDLKIQLSRSYSDFCRTLKSYTTNEQIDALVAATRLNTDNSYDAMSEHLAHQYLLIKENPWLEALPDAERKEIILAAYQQGMNSADERWLMVKQNLVNRAQIKGSANKTIGQVIVGCVQQTVEAALDFAKQISVLTLSIEKGSFTGAVRAIKNLLKSAGARLGWWGLIMAAWDIGTCIYNEI